MGWAVKDQGHLVHQCMAFLHITSSVQNNHENHLAAIQTMS